MSISAPRNNDPSVGERCTSGFIALSDSDAKPYMLTAGHCLAVATNNWAYPNFDDPGSANAIGNRHNHDYNATIGDDWGIIKVPESSSYQGWIFNNPSKFVYKRAIARNTQYKPTVTTNSTEGQILCFAGSRTGSHCGKVRTLGDYKGRQGTIETCKIPEGGNPPNYKEGGTLDGDSGAPMFAKRKKNDTKATANGLLLGLYSKNEPCLTRFASLKVATEKMHVIVLGAPLSN